jgi:hypothetical protein
MNRNGRLSFARLTRLTGPMLAVLVLSNSVCADYPADRPRPVRVGDVSLKTVVDPSACVTRSGAILVAYNKAHISGRELLLSRSTDSGKMWSEPRAIPSTTNSRLTPGSLTALRDGRILLTWTRTDRNADAKNQRQQMISLSSDEGKTWSEARPVGIDLGERGRVRHPHPLLEISESQWLFPSPEQAIAYDPRTGKLAPFASAHKNGRFPIIRTAKGTLVSGAALRSTDLGKTWEAIKNPAKLNDLLALDNGWIVATESLGQGFRLVVSRDDGKSWDLEHPLGRHDAGRAIAGGHPRSVQIDKNTVGTVWFDMNKEQPGGPGVFFMATPLAKRGLGNK